MRIFNQFCLLLIQLYRKCFSPFLPPVCRFVPTCSEYSVECFQRFSFWKACQMTVQRLLRCHPFCKGGFDPVLKPKKDC